MMCQTLAKMKTESNAADIEATTNLLQKLFEISLDDPSDFGSFNYYPCTLEELVEAGVSAKKAKCYFDAVDAVEGPKFNSFVESVQKKGVYKDLTEGSVEYMTVHSKVIAKFNQKNAASGLEAKPKKASTSPKAVSPELQKEADDKKNAGNNAYQKQNFNAAVRLYTEAIDLVPEGPQSHIYYSNRAAAYSNLENHELAVTDCESALALNDKFTKAYLRLGQAYYRMGSYDDAVKAYEMCVQLEPDVKTHKDDLSKAKGKLATSRAVAEEANSSNSSSKAGKGGMGGMADMMNNPDMMKAAESMMGNIPGGIQGLMANPEVKKMVDAMQKDPAMMQQAMASMMGGGGMGGLASMMGGAGSSSSSSGRN